MHRESFASLFPVFFHFRSTRTRIKSWRFFWHTIVVHIFKRSLVCLQAAYQEGERARHRRPPVKSQWIGASFPVMWCLYFHTFWPWPRTPSNFGLPSMELYYRPFTYLTWHWFLSRYAFIPLNRHLSPHISWIRECPELQQELALKIVSYWRFCGSGKESNAFLTQHEHNIWPWWGSEWGGVSIPWIILCTHLTLLTNSIVCLGTSLTKYNHIESRRFRDKNLWCKQNKFKYHLVLLFYIALF